LLGEILLFQLLIAGATIRMLGFALEPAFLSANKAGTSLVIQLVAAAIYAVIAGVGLDPLGLAAIGYGMVAFHVTYLALYIGIGRRLLRKRIRRARAEREADVVAEPVPPGPIDRGY
jgi:hypothetical protein